MPTTPASKRTSVRFLRRLPWKARFPEIRRDTTSSMTRTTRFPVESSRMTELRTRLRAENGTNRTRTIRHEIRITRNFGSTVRNSRFPKIRSSASLPSSAPSRHTKTPTRSLCSHEPRKFQRRDEKPRKPGVSYKSRQSRTDSPRSREIFPHDFHDPYRDSYGIRALEHPIPERSSMSCPCEL